MSEDWVVTPRPNPKARLRLFCFHSAGNGASTFVPWAASMPRDIELNAIQMPGRENRLKDAPYKRIEPVISTLEDLVFPLLDRPFAVFGLSMGALVGFEFARRLRATYGIEPTHFIAASRRAPQTTERLPLLAQLPEPAFLEAVQARYHSIPAVIWQDSELMQLFLPLLRADFTMLETYQYAEDAPLGCPLTVLYGDEDSTLNSEEITSWQVHTRAQFTQKCFTGGHFFTSTHSAAIIDFLVQQGL